MPTTSPLDSSEWSQLREYVATIQAAARKRYGSNLDESLADIDVLQKMIDESVYDATDADALKALGAVFGNVLVKQLAFEWVALEDRHGREPGLRLKLAHSLVINPLRIVSSRVEAGHSIDLLGTFRTIKADVAKTKIL